MSKASKDEMTREILADLARSGLDKKDLLKLRLSPLTRDETDDFVGEPRASYRIPYFDLEGREIAYARCRFLENKKQNLFSPKGKNNNGSFRYSQPFNSSPHVYFPPYHDWRKVANDPEKTILITEGEKKAAKACKEGLYCIALGGVWGFKSSKRLWDLIPELKNIEWKNRTVEICYDADVMLKNEVRAALQSLAFTLTQAYETTRISFVFLDAEVAGPKTSLDDYLIENGVEGFLSLKREEYDVGARIQLLNQKLAYVEKHGRFLDIKNRLYFKSLWHAREAFLNEGDVLIDGKKGMSVVDVWAKSKSRRTFNDLVYEPGSPEVTEENCLNVWVPPAVRPKKGKPKRWLELVHYIMRKPEYAEWFLKWLAFPVQNPGEKLFQACFVYSKVQGVGKTFVVDPVMELIQGRENFHRLKNANLTSSFNAYAGSKTFVVVNEIYLSDYKDRRATMGAIKDMITNERTEVNIKFQPIQNYTDHCNYFFSSNHDDALVIEKDERRLFVIHAPEETLPESTYVELDEYIRHGEGAHNIMHYLQNHIDTSDFNPKGHALMTPYKKQLIQIGRDPLDEFVERIADEPEQLFMVNGDLPDLQLFRAHDVLKLFEREYPKFHFSVTVKRMASKLKATGRIEHRRVALSADGEQHHLYALFEKDGWRSRKNRDWAEHYQLNSRLHGGKGTKH
jgi:hypothetical protein